MNFTPTQEQLDIVAAAKVHPILVIDAYAGAAKTSTIALVSESLPESSLMLVFNKSAKLDADSKFPTHVEVRTTHSLAYGAVGYLYRQKLSRPRGSYVNVAYTGLEIANYFSIKPQRDQRGEWVTSAYLGLLARKSVERFEQSSEDKITSGIVAKEARELGVESTVLTIAKKLWDARVDLTSDVMATHDTYMKIFQLSKPRLEYPIIYLDEAQDTTACTLDIVMRQARHAKIIIVGDKFQSIYCQPAGTRVTKIVGRTERVETLIEDIEEGDRVLSYNLEKAHLYQTGKEVTKFGSRDYDGPLYTATCGGKVASFTEDHKCVVRLGSENKDKHVVYLMRRGKQFRVGSCKFSYKSQGGGFGPALRAAKEGCDGLWILKIRGTQIEARVEEALISTKFGLPELCFVDPSGVVNSSIYELFWTRLGSNEDQALKLFSHFNLDCDKPLWKPCSYGMNSIKFRGGLHNRSL